MADTQEYSDDEQEHNENQGETEAMPKKPYSPPHLTDYGRIHKLTLGFSGIGGTEDPD